LKTTHRRTGGPSHRIAFLALLVCASAPVRLCAQADANPVLDAAVTAFRNVTTMRADFTQVVRDEMIGTNATSRGEWLQQRPNKLAMRWRQPAGDLILADGRDLWIYLPSTAPNQVVKSAVTGAPGQTPDIVADFLERPRERFNVTYVRSEPVGTRPADALAFVPKVPGGAYRRVVIWIDRADSLPRQFEITEASGTVRRITFDKLQVNRPIPASSFVFRPPAGARVIDASPNE
jgi:outer membrane lipoprotein carrier protein